MACRSDGATQSAAAAVINRSIQQSINPILILALALFVARVGADHTNDALAANDLAILAKLLN